MKNDIYNNIGISLVAFLSIIQDFDSITYPKALLIQPLTLHNQLINHIKKKNVKVLSIEDLILNKTEYFLNFNERYYDLLPLSINTILIAKKLGLIEMSKDKIIPIKEEIKKINLEDNNSIGNRAKNIYIASKNINKLLDENDEELYFKLRIKL